MPIFPLTSRTKRILRWLASFCVLGMCGVAWIGYEIFSTDSSRNQASARECVVAWGRLAPFPASVTNFKITTTGSSFSREFRCSFDAPAAEIETWLERSPGISDAETSSPSPHIRHFKIRPGGGAQHAEVTVDDARHQVSIYVYWS